MSDKTYEDFFSDEKKAEIQEYIRRLADYKAKRISFENYRKILKARLMKKAQLAGHTSVQAQEREAYGNPEYEKVIDAIQIATEEETKAYWELEMFKTEIDVWRTEQANNRRFLDS
jgi:prolyl oligopeptidase PreP (S9A serine peptidase family)